MTPVLSIAAINMDMHSWLMSINGNWFGSFIWFLTKISKKLSFGVGNVYLVVFKAVIWD